MKKQTHSLRVLAVVAAVALALGSVRAGDAAAPAGSHRCRQHTDADRSPTLRADRNRRRRRATKAAPTVAPTTSRHRGPGRRPAQLRCSRP